MIEDNVYKPVFEQVITEIAFKKESKKHLIYLVIIFTKRSVLDKRHNNGTGPALRMNK